MELQNAYDWLESGHDDWLCPQNLVKMCASLCVISISVSQQNISRNRSRRGGGLDLPRVLAGRGRILKS